MNFSCDRCQKLYSIADEKVAGRAFKVTCKQCGHVIQVKASHPGAAAAPPVAPRPVASAPPAPPRAGPPVAPAPPPPRAPPPAPPPPAPARAAPPAAPPRAATPAASTASPPRAAPRPAPVPPAPVAPAATPPPAPVLPAVDPPSAQPQDSLEHQTLDSTAHYDLFYKAAPTHRPRVTAEWMLQNRKRHPYLLVVGAAVAGLVVAGGVALSIWQVQRPRTGPAEASEKSRYQPPPPAPPPQNVLMPAETVKGAAPAPPPMQVDLPPEQPLAQRGAAAPRGVGGQAGFESVGSGAGGSDVREKLRQRNLTIAKKDRRLLDLLDKKADAAPTRAGAVERTALDSGGAALDEGAVRQTMAASASAYSACVTRAVKENPNLRVDGKRATLMLTIKASGVVQSAWIAEATLDKSPLGKCLVSTARRMIFPAFSGDPIDVSVPLALSTQL